MQTVNKEIAKLAEEKIVELGRENPDSIFSLVGEARRRGLFDKEYKDRGSEYLVCCPFHNDEDPSMSIRESTQSFYCYGCEARGGLVSFLAHWAQDVEAKKVSYYGILEGLVRSNEVLRSKIRANSIYHNNFMEDGNFKFKSMKIDADRRLLSPQEVARSIKNKSDEEKLATIAKLQDFSVEEMNRERIAKVNQEKTESMELFTLAKMLGE